MTENNLRWPITHSSYLIPGTDDSSKKHKEVTHGNQAGPDHQGENSEQLLEDGLDADQKKDSEENSQRSGDSDYKGDVILDILQRVSVFKKYFNCTFQLHLHDSHWIIVYQINYQ